MPLSLLEQVVDLLDRSEVPHCLIGAAAMAAHGAPRSTLDLDLLTTEQRALDDSLWQPLREVGAEVKVRQGDFEDPLAGVVRATAVDERAVDVIVGRFSWQAEIIGRSLTVFVQGADVRVAEPADLILLKLYAGGPQDRWDIQQLLAAQQSEGVGMLVEDRLAQLPAECADIWRDVRR